MRGRWWLDPEDVWAIRTEGRELVGRSAAAEILGVSGTRVTQLAEADLIPYVEVRLGRSTRRMFRRGQLEVVANAREARWHAFETERLLLRLVQRAARLVAL